MIVMYGIDQAGDSGMEKGGVADKAHYFLIGCARKTTGRADPATHTDHEIGRGKRRQHAQSITADIARIKRKGLK